MLCDFYNEALEYQENLLANYYVKHGHQVTIITSTYESVFDYYSDRHDNATPERRYRHGGALIIKLRYRYNILNKLRAFTQIASILHQEAPDLIFVHDIMLNLPECVRYVQRHPQCRMIMDYHADYSNSGKNSLSLKVLHGVFRKWFLDRARPYLARIFPIVPAGATFLHEIYDVPHSEMELLPLGADTDLVRQVRGTTSRHELRARFGIDSEDIVIFTGGKLTPSKRTEILLEAVGLVEGRTLHVIVVGDASDDHVNYKQDLHRLSVANPHVHMVGWLGRREIYEHLAMADLAVFPASQSILWQQAIAMGLPLIAGDTGHQDISYLNLKDNIIVLPAEKITVHALAKAIESVVGNPERLRRMSEGASLVSDEHLNWDRLIERTLRFNLPAGAQRDS